MSETEELVKLLRIRGEGTTEWQAADRLEALQAEVGVRPGIEFAIGYLELDAHKADALRAAAKANTTALRLHVERLADDTTLIRALLGLSPWHDTAHAVRVLYTQGRAAFEAMRDGEASHLPPLGKPSEGGETVSTDGCSFGLLQESALPTRLPGKEILGSGVANDSGEYPEAQAQCSDAGAPGKAEPTPSVSVEELARVLRSGVDIVSGTWDGLYELDDEIAWVKEAEAVLGVDAAQSRIGSAIGCADEGEGE